MTDALSFEGNNRTGVADHATLRRVYFVAEAAGEDKVLMTFTDPSPRKALIASTRLNGPLTEGAKLNPDTFEVLTVPHPPNDNPSLRDELCAWVEGSTLPNPATPIGTIFHGAQVFWRPGRAAILAAPDRLELLLLALVDFGYYENELRKLEQEVADSWPFLEADSHLAHEVLPADLERLDEIGNRTKQARQRQIRYARIEPHLSRPSTHLSLQAQELGARFREKSRIEDRQETLGGQLELFDHVYEMASQRLSEDRNGRQERKLEWIIIVLLAAETLLLLASILHALQSP